MGVNIITHHEFNSLSLNLKAVLITACKFTDSRDI